MRNVIRMSAVGIGLTCTLFLASPAIADSPQEMCSRQTTPGLFSAVMPMFGGQTTESCVTVAPQTNVAPQTTVTR